MTITELKKQYLAELKTGTNPTHIIDGFMSALTKIDPGYAQKVYMIAMIVRRDATEEDARKFVDGCVD